MEEFYEHLANNLIAYTLFLLILSVGLVLTWLITKNKANNTIAALKTRIAKLEFQLSEKMYLLEDGYKQNEETLRSMLVLYKNAILEEDKAKIIGGRADVSNFFYKDYLNSFYKYTRLAREINRNDNEAEKKFVCEQLYPFLRISTEVTASINQENVLALTDKKALKVQERNFNFITEYAQEKKNYLSKEDRLKLDNFTKSLA